MANSYDKESTNKHPVVKKILLARLLCLQLFCLSITWLIPVESLAKSEPKPVRIAVNLPLTGPIAAFCGQYPNGLIMGIEDECKHLGIDKSKFILDVQDNAGKPSQGVAILHKQMLQPPSLYISGVSPISLAIAPEISKAGISHVLVAFDAFICRDGQNRLRILPHYKIEGPTYVEYAKSHHAKRVFIISNINSAYDAEFEKIVEPSLDKLGITHKREHFDFDTKDFRAIALKAVEYKPDLILVAGFSVHIYPILGALRSYGLVKKENVLCTLDFIDLLHNKTPKSELVSVPFIVPSFELPALKTSGKVTAWTNRYEQLFKYDPSYIEAYAYDTGRIVVDAYNKYGTIGTESIRKILPFQGISGEINIDKDGDLSTKLHVAQVMPDGSVKEIAL
jgi:branched-chain amino acid transport system substrate-binding protein